MHSEIKCAACESSIIEQLPFKINGGYPIVECKECGLKFILSANFETLDDDEYWDDVNKQIYKTPSVLKEIEKRHEKYLRKIKTKNPPNNKLLDVGSGNGTFLASSKQAGFEPVGIEPSPVAVQLCQEIYSLSPVCGYLEMDSELPKDFGVLTAWDVIEHVSDPKHFLEICYSHLQEGGILALETPDESSMIRKLINIISPFLIKSIDLRSRIYYINHRYYFTHYSIIKLLQRVGFSNVSIYTDHSIHSRGCEKIRLYQKYGNIQMIMYKLIFFLLKIPFFSNKQIILAQRTT